MIEIYGTIGVMIVVFIAGYVMGGKFLNIDYAIKYQEIKKEFEEYKRGAGK